MWTSVSPCLVASDEKDKVLQRNMLLAAAKSGDAKMVFALLQRTSLPVDHVAHSSGATLLHLAAERGHVDVVSFLLGKGAEVGAYTRSCQSST
jgi:ankyrin repeat protein